MNLANVEGRATDRAKRGEVVKREAAAALLMMGVARRERRRATEAIMVDMCLLGGGGESGEENGRKREKGRGDRGRKESGGGVEMDDGVREGDDRLGIKIGSVVQKQREDFGQRRKAIHTPTECFVGL